MAAEVGAVWSFWEGEERVETGVKRTWGTASRLHEFLRYLISFLRSPGTFPADTSNDTSRMNPERVKITGPEYLLG